MKGMLIKDVKLMKNQMMFFIAIIFMSIAFSAMWENPFFAIGYATSLVSIFTISTISYDDYENGMAYLFTLPISRREYVMEKYLFGVLSTFLALVAAAAIAFGIGAVQKIEFSMDEFVSVAAMSLVMASFILAFSLPVQLKFGAERSRVALLLVMGIAVLIGFLTVKATEAAGVNLEAVLDGLFQDSLARTFIILVLIGIALLVISYQVSVRIREKKEL